MSPQKVKALTDLAQRLSKHVGHTMVVKGYEPGIVERVVIDENEETLYIMIRSPGAHFPQRIYPDALILQCSCERDQP